MKRPIFNLAMALMALAIGLLAGLGPFEAPLREPGTLDWSDLAGEGAVLLAALVGALTVHRFDLAPESQRSILFCCVFFIIAGTLDVLDEIFRIEAFLPGFVKNGARLVGVGTLVATMAQLGSAVQRAEEEREVFRARSRTDGLTRLENRASLDASLSDIVDGARAGAAQLSAMFLDIDDFKQINDRHGHALGDEVLKALASAVRASVRGADHAFRVGGEELAVLLADTSIDGAMLVAERIRRRFSRQCAGVFHRDLAPTVSIGVAALAPDDTGHTLLARADKAMYCAKSAGKNQVVADSDPVVDDPVTRA